MRRKLRKKYNERYELECSPFSQRPTQKRVASLLSETRDNLRRLVNYKEQFIVRRKVMTGKNGKSRDLAYPVSRLRAVHERFKFHLNKIKQPSYLFSPRKNFSQRDNAAHHLDQFQYLTLDLKQFYPSTTRQMIFDWLSSELGMYEDVAGLLSHLCTVDEQASLGSPLTPVLCSLVHRKMFDQIADICDKRGLRYSVWVDDLTISGNFVPGTVLNEIREVIRSFGLKSHRIKYRNGNKPVFVTGIGIIGKNLIAPKSYNLKLKRLKQSLDKAATDDERDSITLDMLSLLGTIRYISGSKSNIGQKAANQMNMLKQKKIKRDRKSEHETMPMRVSDSNMFMPIDNLDAPF